MIGSHPTPQVLHIAFTELLAPLSENKSLCVEIRLDAEVADLEVWIDRERMVRVLSNLIGNAVKFTPPGGSVTVGAVSPRLSNSVKRPYCVIVRPAGASAVSYICDSRRAALRIALAWQTDLSP